MSQEIERLNIVLKARNRELASQTHNETVSHLQEQNSKQQQEYKALKTDNLKMLEQKLLVAHDMKRQ